MWLVLQGITRTPLPNVRSNAGTDVIKLLVGEGTKSSCVCAVVWFCWLSRCRHAFGCAAILARRPCGSMHVSFCLHVAGNKCDLETQRKVTYEKGARMAQWPWSTHAEEATVPVKNFECAAVVAAASGKAFADLLGIDFYETSAKDSLNAEQVIHCCALPPNLPASQFDFCSWLTFGTFRCKRECRGAFCKAFTSLAGQIKNKKSTSATAPHGSILDSSSSQDPKKGCC